jgi:hypothetical protein
MATFEYLPPTFLHSTKYLDLMDPAAYDEGAYRAELLRKVHASESIVYQAVFAPDRVAGGQTVLVAATSSGLIHVYQLGRIMQPAYWDQVGRGECVVNQLATT